MSHLADFRETVSGVVAEWRMLLRSTTPSPRQYEYFSIDTRAPQAMSEKSLLTQVSNESKELKLSGGTFVAPEWGLASDVRSKYRLTVGAALEPRLGLDSPPSCRRRRAQHPAYAVMASAGDLWGEPLGESAERHAGFLLGATAMRRRGVGRAR